ncbi:MAG TPA: FecR domain-containing protein [Cyclobacteriaceae bacterium]|nr:FecR domain-containing protein [Cyclobacteriaceae bacterium]
MVKNENEIEVNDELIIRYLTGEAEPEEAMTLQDWLQSQQNRTYFESFQSAWNNSYPARKPNAPNREKVWAALRTQIASKENTKEENEEISRPFTFYLKIAASILILLTAGTFAYYMLRDYNFSRPKSITTTNEQREVILPDKSHVILSRNSSVAFDEQFKGNVREVNFSGEAFFHVSHDPQKPFIIHTRLADIRVIGTSFNVAEAKDSVQISVEEGKVMVITKLDTAFLEQSQTVVAKAGTSIIEKVVNDPNNYAYATRKFSFKNTRLKEVFRCIEKSFPYTIAIQNKAIENCRLTANFDNTSADYMMSLIAETLDLSVTKNDHEFILEGNGCE